MWLFASYSRKDETAVRELISDLQRAHLSVWYDQELRGGDPWWQDILRRIRECDVFLFLLSHDSLASKPCLTELSYARALGLPILPVQVGPVENLRLTPVADIQVVDYRERTLAKGMELLDAIQQAVTERRPLPEPLPEPPPVPFEYLLRLGSAIGAAQLTPDQQGDFIRQLRDCLETEDDEGVKDDARELLRALRRRPDITYRNAQAIDQLLTALTAAPTGATARGDPPAGEGTPASPTAADDHEPEEAQAADVGAGGRPGRRLRTGSHAASPGHPERARRTRQFLAASALLLALAALGAIWLLGRGDTIPPSTVVLAQPAADVGPEPFAESSADAEGTRPISLDGTVHGGTPGLYGGTGTNVCNAEGMAHFLANRPTMAEAWAAVVGTTVDELAPYLSRLTPVTLRTDTAVTNHGFRDGRALPFHAVLQAGTAVLIDEYGGPRVRCVCGNPLAEPGHQPPRVEGADWAGFTPETVTVVKPAPAPVEEFVVLREDTGDFVARPQGTQGNQDDRPDPVAEQQARELPTRSDAGSPSGGGGAGEQSDEGGEDASGNERDTPSTVPGEDPRTPPGDRSGEGTDDGAEDESDAPPGGTVGGTGDDVETGDAPVERVLPGGGNDAGNAPSSSSSDGSSSGGSGGSSGSSGSSSGSGSGTGTGDGAGTPPGGTEDEDEAGDAGGDATDDSAPTGPLPGDGGSELPADGSGDTDEGTDGGPGPADGSVPVPSDVPDDETVLVPDDASGDGADETGTGTGDGSVPDAGSAD